MYVFTCAVSVASKNRLCYDTFLFICVTYECFPSVVMHHVWSVYPRWSVMDYLMVAHSAASLQIHVQRQHNITASGLVSGPNVTSITVRHVHVCVYMYVYIYISVCVFVADLLRDMCALVICLYIFIFTHICMYMCRVCLKCDMCENICMCVYACVFVHCLGSLYAI